MSKNKKSYYLNYVFVKRLSGFSFYRLSVYHKNKMVSLLGYLEIDTNILFVDFSLLYYYIYRGFDFISFRGNIGRNLRELHIGSILMLGLFHWLFFSKESTQLIMPKKFWNTYISRSLYIVYYLLFRNLIAYEEQHIKIFPGLGRILIKRVLVIKKLNLVTEC